MARSSEVSSAGYRSRVASRSHRWAGVEYAASSRVSSKFRLRSALGTAGIRGAEKISRSPGRRTTPAGWLRSTMPATVSNPPASTSRPRGHAPPANRINPRTVNSALVRINLRTRLFRVGRVSKEAPATSEELHTARFRRCPRSLIATSCTRLGAACRHQQYACAAGRSALRNWGITSAIDSRRPDRGARRRGQRRPGERPSLVVSLPKDPQQPGDDQGPGPVSLLPAWASRGAGDENRTRTTLHLQDIRLATDAHSHGGSRTTPGPEVHPVLSAYGARRWPRAPSHFGHDSDRSPWCLQGNVAAMAWAAGNCRFTKRRTAAGRVSSPAWCQEW